MSFNDKSYQNAVLSRGERLQAEREECNNDHPWHDCPKCGIGICGDHMVAFLNHSSHEPPALRAGERDTTLCGRLSEHDAGSCHECRQIQYATLIEQRERLVQLLRQFVSPTHCYCPVLAKSKKCGQCEARELLATIEQEEV